MSVYAVDGESRLEDIGEGWVAYSAPSGETLVLNIEAAAIVEVLQQEPQDEMAVARALASQAGMPVEQVHARLQDGWSQLLTAGLIRRVDVAADNGV